MHLLSRRDDEHGFAVVLVGLTLTVIMLFAALAIDFGLVVNQRRQDQTAADGGALAGGGELLRQRQLGIYDADTIVRIVQETTHENLQLDLPLVDWKARWGTATCSDPDRPAGYVAISAATECVSTNAAQTRLRVRIPDVDVETQFGKVAGVDSFATSAFAEIELVPAGGGGGGGVLPFGLPQGEASENEACLKAAPQDTSVPECSGGTMGNFGSLDIRWFGNALLGTPTACDGHSANNRRMAVNMALGIDHRLDEWRGPEEGPPVDVTEGIRNDRDECRAGADLSTRPNQVEAQTGVGAALDAGMVDGTSLVDRHVAGRLTVTPFDRVKPDQRIKALDNWALWQFLDPLYTGNQSPIPSCRGVTTKAAMVVCIDAWEANPVYGPLFTSDLAQSPRFAYVPELWDPAFGTCSERQSTRAVMDPALLPPNGFPPCTEQDYEVKRFRPVFLQTAYFKSCSNQSGCDVVFNPGETPFVDDPHGNPELVALTALTLAKEMLPTAMLADDPGLPSSATNYQLVLRR